MLHDGFWAAAVDRHVERVDYLLFAHVVSHGPADDATAADVEERRQGTRSRRTSDRT